MDNKKSLYQLTELQKKYLPAVEWLLDYNSNIATGRSFLMAVVFIRMAIRRPGVKIYVFDHYPNRQAAERVLNIIKSILSKNEEIFKHCKFWRDGFTIDRDRRNAII